VVDHLGEPIPPERLRDGGQYGAWGVDGRYYAQYGVGQSLLAVPFYLAGRAVHRLSGWGTEGLVTRAGVMLLNPLVMAVLCAAVHRLAYRLGYGPGPALGVALVTGLATPLWVYSKSFFSEPLVALAFVTAALGALEGDGGRRAGWVLCGTALGVAVLVKPVTLAVAPAFLVYALAGPHATTGTVGQSGESAKDLGSRFLGRVPSLALVAGPLCAGAIGVALYNWARFGSPVDAGYRTAAWSVAPWVGLYGLLLSPGKGLLWYCPPLALGLAGFVPLAKRRPRTAGLLAGAPALYVLAHASYNHWHGGGSWGPRLILPVLPLLLAPLAEWLARPLSRAWTRLALAALLVAGCLVQVPAILVNPVRTLQSLYVRAASPRDYTLRQLYRVADSPLLGQWLSLLEVAGLMRDPERRAAVAEAAEQVKETAAASGNGLTKAAGLLAVNAFNVWPVLWGLLGAPLPALLIAEGALLALAGWAGRRLWVGRSG
jgi:hypothetical protein